MFEKFKRVIKEPSPLSVTMTGEPYQPARLYYQVQQKNAVLGRFKRLRCIDIVNKLFPATAKGEEMSHHHRLFFEQCLTKSIS